MKRWLILFPFCILFAADIEDLGIVSPRKPIVLETEEKDFSHYVIKIFHTGSYQTNDILVTNTTGILTVHGELREVYPGKQMMEVVSFTKDGDASEPSRFSFELRKSKPRRPAAKAVKLDDLPPSPPGMTNYVPLRATAQPLPDSNYAEERQKR